MNKKELIEQLKTITKKIYGDNEDYHRQADFLLLQYINDEKVTKAFEEVPKWYS